MNHLCRYKFYPGSRKVLILQLVIHTSRAKNRTRVRNGNGLLYLVEDYENACTVRQHILWTRVSVCCFGEQGLESESAHLVFKT